MKKIWWWLVGIVAVISAAYWLSQWLVGSSAPGYSLRELLNSGQEQKCFFSEKADETKSESAVYTTTGKLRSHFVSTTAKQTISAYMLLDGNYMYTWLDGFDLGLKTPLKTTGSNNAKNSIDLDKKLDYRCAPWVPESNGAKNLIFDLPSAIRFTEMTT